MNSEQPVTMMAMGRCGNWPTFFNVTEEMVNWEGILIGKAIKFILSLILGLALIGLFISTTAVMPNNAQVLINEKKNVYYAPPYVAELIVENPNMFNENKLKISDAITAETFAVNPDPECRDLGYFQQDERCITLKALEEIGLLKPEKSRWNKDGTWNW